MTYFLLGLAIFLCLALSTGIAVLRNIFLMLDPETIQDIQNRDGNRWLKKLVRRTDSVVGALTFGRDVMALLAVVLFTVFGLHEITALKLVVHVAVVAIFVSLLTRALPERLVYIRSVRWALALQLWIYALYLFFALPAGFVAWFANQIGFVAKRHFMKVDTLFDTGLYINAVRRGDRAVAMNDDGQTAHILQSQIAQFSRKIVEQVMQPASELHMVDGSLPAEEVINAVIHAPVQRVVLYEDHPGNIIGIIHAGLLMKALCEIDGDRNGVDVMSVASEPLYTKAGTTIIEQINQFHQRNESFALVTDASNRVIGSVSMDIIHANMMAALSQ